MATTLLESVLADRERILGPDHQDTQVSYGNLARTYELVGRTDEAIALLERLLECRERLLGSDHPATESVAAYLQRLQASTGKS